MHDAMAGELTIMADNARGLVIAKGSGFWSIDQVTRHFDELAHILHAVRTLRGRADLIAHFGDAAQQAMATRSAVKMGASNAFSRADAVALICPHEGFARQMQDAAGHPRLAVFSDQPSALDWLIALQGNADGAAP